MKNHRSEEERKRRPGRIARQERRRWDDDAKSPLALGCGPCPELGRCGGLHQQFKTFNCMDECCHDPANCTAMCPDNPTMFIARMREINDLDFNNISRAAKVTTALLPAYAPHFYHGSSRGERLATDVAALPLHVLYKRRDGSAKFATRTELAAAFGIHENTKIVLVGSGHDASIEAWWKLSEKRQPLLAMIADHGYELVTGPNYSLFTNQLRWDDMHSMKRIAITQQEFAAAGVPCALHLNGRTPRDYERWANYLRERDEITHVVFEFGTVWRWPLRREFHLQHLIHVANAVGRPLHMTMIGGMEAVPALAQAYAKLTVVDAVPFLKAVKRQKLTEGNDLKLRSHPAPTGQGEPIGPLLAHNVDVSRARTNRIISEACAAALVGRIAPTLQIPEKKVFVRAARSSTPDAAQKSSVRDLLIETEDRR